MEMQKTDSIVVKKKKKWFIPIIIISLITLVVIFLMVGIIVTIIVVTVSKEGKLQSQLDLGQKYLNELDFEQAIISYEEALNIEPKSVDGYVGLADVYITMEDYESALQVLQAGYTETGDGLLLNKIKEVQEEISNLNYYNEEELDGDTLITNDEIVIVDEDGDGKHDPDVFALEELINVQNSRGASVSTDINSSSYEWLNGRLVGIYWGYEDLSGDISFSTFEQLQIIECNNSNSDKMLTSIDVSGNLELLELNCSGHYMYNLDVSNNVKLQELNCYDNLLAELDVTQNTELTRLVCGRNILINLDISNNKKLVNLDCSHNNLASIDLSNNTEIEYLFCAWNDLVDLDVSKLTKLKKLDCGTNRLVGLNLSNNLDLEELVAPMNNFSVLDLTSNTKLVYVYTNNVEVIGYDFSNQSEY